MSVINEILKGSSVLQHYKEGKTDFCMENEIALSFFLSEVFPKSKKTILVITSTINEAQLIFTNITQFIDKSNVLFFPSEEAVRLKKISSSKEIVGERIYTLGALASSRSPKIVICNFQSAIRFLVDPVRFRENTFSVKKGDNFKISLFKEKLLKAGYQKVDKITASLQFAARGDVLDLFPINSKHPIRIDFFDNEIEEIREFRISNQQSFNSLQSIDIYPASEHLLTRKELDLALLKVDKLSSNEQLRDHLIEQFDMAFPGYLPSILERFVDYLGLEKNSIFDYLDNPLTILFNKYGIEKEKNSYLERQSKYNMDLSEKNESIPNIKVFHDYSLILKQNLIETSLLDSNSPSFGISYTRNSNIRQDSNFSFLRSFLERGYFVEIGLDSVDTIKSLAASLDAARIHYSINSSRKANLNLIVRPLYSSFVIEKEKYAFLVESDLFFMRRPAPRFNSHYREGSSIESYLDLDINDYVVHEQYGIAIYRGLISINSFGTERECLRLEYANDDIINVPVLQIDYIRKYLGREGYHPNLTRLHTKDWDRLKKRVKDEINESYDKLLQLYKTRLKEPGISFDSFTEFEDKLVDTCPFELTSDQEKSVKEVFNDMKQPYPMDRLLCGDVGFGKTEVALRATMRAIVNDYQVCLVCPTTILAGQHYELFKHRLAPIGFKVGLLSRFSSKKEQKDTIRQLSQGKIQVLISTHRALSADVCFPRLGLLIIDEEQRFGVKQKEALKHKYPNVDVLTLSATPIPRTLQMSLLNLRPISKIATPPPYRNPIQTYVVNREEELIKEIIERELARNGQVFYLSNWIAGLENKVRELETDISSARVGLIHGQLDPSIIEEELLRFNNQETNVLVCTTIIENGIDYPNANTLIVENAERFGLAQLYQIKGRVGRSDRIAYAYFLYDSRKMTATGNERLKAIQAFTDLGSGYKIAEQDLLIRGAGEIIGESQSGFISNVGLDMYAKLFDDVMYERESEKQKVSAKKADLSFFDSVIKEVDTNDAIKIELYQRLSRVSNFEELAVYDLEIRDEFGKLPDGMNNIIAKKTLDLYTNVEPILSITEEVNDAIVTVDPNVAILLNRFFPKFENRLIKFSKFTPGEIRMVKEDDYLQQLICLVQDIINKSKELAERI